MKIERRSSGDSTITEFELAFIPESIDERNLLMALAKTFNNLIKKYR